MVRKESAFAEFERIVRNRPIDKPDIFKVVDYMGKKNFLAAMVSICKKADDVFIESLIHSTKPNTPRKSFCC